MKVRLRNTGTNLLDSNKMNKIFFIVLIFSFIYVLSNIAWHIFIYLFKMLDDYMMDKHFEKLGYEKAKCKEGKDWYIG